MIQIEDRRIFGTIAFQAAARGLAGLGQWLISIDFGVTLAVAVIQDFVGHQRSVVLAMNTGNVPLCGGLLHNRDVQRRV